MASTHPHRLFVPASSTPTALLLLLGLGLSTVPVGVVAEKVTFFVSPDTHFTQCAGFEDPESSNQNMDVHKNERGIHDMLLLPGAAYPAQSKGGTVEPRGNIRGVVVPGDLIDDGCNPKASVRTPGPVATFVKGPGALFTHTAQHLDSSDAPAGESGGYVKCLAAKAPLGTGVCVGNVTACAASCARNATCAAFTFGCGTPQSCSTVATLNTTSAQSFRCVFKTSVKYDQPPNYTIANCSTQWANYTAHFGLLPAEGTVPYPVYEGLGNHDGEAPKGGLPNTGAGVPPTPGTHVWDAVVARNRRRVGLADEIGAGNYSLSPNGLHYSWEWGGVHLAMLNLYPGNAGKGPQAAALYCPSWSLDFLEKDLAKVPASQPVVVFFHYPVQNQGDYWSESEALDFARAIQHHNVVAIVHGHTHSCNFYKWDVSNTTGRVYDVFNAPALQKGGATDAEATPSQYLVFEIDDAARSLRVFQRVGSTWGTITHESTYDKAPREVAAVSPGPEGGASGTGTPMSFRVVAEEAPPSVPPTWVP